MYPQLQLLKRSDRPTFFSNFVQTIDGKVAVVENGAAYWPIGSSTDHATLIELRTHADALIHGSTTALNFTTTKSLGKAEFQTERTKLGKSRPLLYVVCSTHPTEKLLSQLLPAEGVEILVVTTTSATLPQEIPDHIEILRLGVSTIDLTGLSDYLFSRGYNAVLLEGGPRLLGSFVELGLLDEIFLTISPKIYGGNRDTTLSMTDGELVKPANLASYTLVENQTVGNELFLHYQIM